MEIEALEGVNMIKQMDVNKVRNAVISHTGKKVKVRIQQG